MIDCSKFASPIKHLYSKYSQNHVFLKIKKKRYNLDEIRRLLSCLDIEPDASFWYWHSLIQSFLWHAISIVPYRTSCLLPILVFILAERGVKSCQSLKRNSRGFQAKKKELRPSWLVGRERCSILYKNLKGLGAKKGTCTKV